MPRKTYASLGRVLQYHVILFVEYYQLADPFFSLYRTVLMAITIISVSYSPFFSRYFLVHRHVTRPAHLRPQKFFVGGLLITVR